jgi:hypothetical protein
MTDNIHTIAIEDIEEIFDHVEKIETMLKGLARIALREMTGEDFESMYNEMVENMNEKDIELFDCLIDDLTEDE